MNLPTLTILSHTFPPLVSTGSVAGPRPWYNTVHGRLVCLGSRWLLSSTHALCTMSCMLYVLTSVTAVDRYMYIGGTHVHVLCTCTCTMSCSERFALLCLCSHARLPRQSPLGCCQPARLVSSLTPLSLLPTHPHLVLLLCCLGQPKAIISSGQSSHFPE